MSEQQEKTRWSPRDYCRVGPVYIRKNLLLAGAAAASLAVLGVLGPPRLVWRHQTAQPPVYSFDDPALQLVTGRVQITDADGRVRYVGEVDRGRYAGQGWIHDASGQPCREVRQEEGRDGL